MFENLLFGFGLIFSEMNLLIMVLGVLVGIFVGMTPGLNVTTGVALALPLTYSMSPPTALIFLCAIYMASEYGGSISAILINTPGTGAVVDELLSEIREQSFAGIYCAMHKMYARRQGKPRWGQKTPGNSFFVGPIRECFPNAQFIFITRDGKIKRFKFPVRSTPEGSAKPDGGWETGTEDLKDPVLASEPGSLGTDVPIPKK